MLWVWLRAIMSLSVSRLLGPTATYAVLLLKDVMKFMAFYSLITIAFTCFFGLILIDNEEFKNIYLCLYRMIMASLLFLDLKLLDLGSERTQIYAYAFIAIYLFVSVVTINLLIAILCYTYTTAEKQGKILYLSQTVSLRPLYKYDKRYTYYISAPFPFTVLLLPSLPLVIFNFSYEIVNNIMLHSEYLPLSIAYIVLFFAINLLLLPFTFIKVCLHKFLLLLRKTKIPFWSKFIRFSLYLAFGILTSLYASLSTPCTSPADFMTRGKEKAPQSSTHAIHIWSMDLSSSSQNSRAR